MFVVTVLGIEEVVECRQSCSALRVVFDHDGRDGFRQPSSQFSDLHVVVELDEADIADALEGQCG